MLPHYKRSRPDALTLAKAAPLAHHLKQQILGVNGLGPKGIPRMRTEAYEQVQEDLWCPPVSLSIAVAYSHPQTHIFKIWYNYLLEITVCSLLGSKAIK